MAARILLALLLAGVPAHAQLALENGDLLVYSYSPVFCDTCSVTSPLTVLDSSGFWKASPNIWSTGVFAPAPDRVLISQQWHVDYGGAKLLWGRGFDRLGEILETRAGHYLVAETSSGGRPALVRFASDGGVLEVMRLPAGARARNIELLSDQCTLLHTSGWDADATESRRVRQFNICTGRAEEDLFSVPDDAMLAGGIRQLPGGELLIATGTEVRRFDLSGKELAIYPVPATHIGLTPDASGFWAAWGRTLQRINFESPAYISTIATVQENHTGAFAVVGEWRAAVREPYAPRRRAVR